MAKPKPATASPLDMERLLLGLLSRLLIRLTGDPDHDDEIVRDFCLKLDLPYRDIRAMTYVNPSTAALH